jgi:tetrahydromethanopterin S-methyltransferase subunit D
VDDLAVPPGWAPPRRWRTLAEAAAALTLGVAAICAGAALLVRPTTTVVVDLAIVLFGAGVVSGAHRMARPALHRRQPRGVTLGKDAGGAPVLRIRKPVRTRLIDAAGLLCAGVSFLLFWWSGALFAGWFGQVVMVVGVVLAVGSPFALVSSSEVELGPRGDPGAIGCRAAG